MLRGHLIGRKKRHKQSVLFIGLFLIFALSVGVAILYGMRWSGVGAIAILYVIAGWIMDATLE